MINALKKGILRFDGGFGSMVAARGIAFDCPERLNLTRADDVRAIHRAYAEAGAQVVETNTLGANPVRLRSHGLQEETEAITRAAVGHARASGAPFAACSMGTTAEFLAPFGPLAFEEAVRGFARQAAAAADAGADILFCETLTDAAEARAMMLAARQAGIAFAASFTFAQNGRTLTGSTPGICALIAQAMGASLVGVNCVGDGALLARAVEGMRAVCPLPVVAQPNAGLPETVDGKLVYRTTPQDLVPMIEGALAAGAAAVGGCCGTTPEHIRRIAPVAMAAPVPAAGGDGIARVCSMRTALPLQQALDGYETLAWDEIDTIDAEAALVDLRGASPEDVDEMMDELLTLVKEPVLFRADDEAVLATALRRYPGVAGVDAPFAPGYGALKI